MNHTLHILTGEYPPSIGGIGGYTERLAHMLADTGLDVHVWCPADHSRNEAVGVVGGVTVHRVRGLFRARGRRRFEAVARSGDAWTLLLQYTPNALGMRGLNIGFCGWLAGLRRRLWKEEASPDIRIMFHEPFYYFSWRGAHRNLLAAAHRLMAMLLLRAATTVYTSTSSWQGLLRPYAPSPDATMQWLPIFANIRRVRDEPEIERCRARLRLGMNHTVVLGHFGNYGADAAAVLLEAVLLDVLGKRTHVHVLLLGQGNETFRARLITRQSHLQDRITATGTLPAAELSSCIELCDVALQPYADGATSRRSSLMAMLTHGVAVVVNDGVFTEDVWRAEGARLLVRGLDAAGMSARVLELVDDAAERASTAAEGLALAERRFSEARTLEILLPQRSYA